MPIFGTEDADVLHGTSGDDEIVGRGGGDRFELEQGGNDTARGGDGIDLFVLGATLTAADRIDGGGDFDRVDLAGDYSFGLVLDWRTLLNIEWLRLEPGFSYSITASDGLAAAGGETIIGQSSLGAGDVLVFDGSAESDGGFRIDSGGGDDVITGGAGDDTIFARGGDDIVAGGGGANTVYTDEGDDTVTVTGGSSAASTPFNLVHLGTGTDHLIVDYSGLTTRLGMDWISVDQGERRTDFHVGPVNEKVLTLTAWEMERITVRSGSGDDRLQLNTTGDEIFAGGGNDLITARSFPPNWAVTGRARVDGGAGLDGVTIDWSDLTEAVVYDATGPAEVTIGAGDSERYLRNVEVLEEFHTGSGDDEIVMGPGGLLVPRQHLHTHGGDDEVVVRMGVDSAETGTFWIYMGDGFDSLTYDFSAVAGSASRNHPLGTRINGTFTIGADDVEQLTIIGSDGDDSFEDPSELVDNFLYGGAGDDLLGSYGGTDLAEGGIGSDRLVVDYSHVHTHGAMTMVVASAASATGLGGHDGSFGAGGYSIAFTSIEHFTFYTSSGNDEVVTRAGNDRIFAEWGQDVVHAGDGADWAEGGSGDDELYGEAGNDRLVGDGGPYTGNDRLDGGTGADTMTGGPGDDLYVVDNVGDRVSEASAEDGSDTVESSVDFALAAHVENLVLTGSAAIGGTGNSLANAITGNAAANLINGAGGADVMAGAGGDDVYIVETAGDQAVEAAGEGIDLVKSSISFTLGANVEKLTLRGGAAVDGTGNGLANTIAGNAAANLLDGGAGADRMLGAGGNDIYVVDDLFDQVIETSSGGGTDLVRSSVSFTLGDHVERLTLTGAAAADGTGNDLANLLNGNSAANLLDGGRGNDTLAGGGGGDTLRGGLGSDSLQGDGGADDFVFDKALGATNVDFILDFAAGSDTILLENAVFKGLAAGAFNANALAIGSAAADADDRIVYDPTTGNLYYDADGNGAAAQILFATLDNAPATLGASDFAVI